MNKARLARELVQAALAFAGRRLWERIENDEVFGLVLPDRATPVVASVMGAAGISYGLTLFIGDDAVADARSILTTEEGDDEPLSRSAQISFSMEPWHEIGPPWRRVLELAGFRCRREALAPLFISKPSGERPRVPNSAELRMMLTALNSAMRADEEGLLTPASVTAGDDLLTLTVTGEPLHPEVTAGCVAARTPGPAVPLSPPALPEGLLDLPRTEARWLIAFPRTPVSVRNDNRVLRAFFVAEDGEEGPRPLDAWLLPEAEAPDAAGRLFGLFEGRPPHVSRGVPREVVFTSRMLFDLLAPALAVVGIATRYEVRVEALEDLVADCIESLCAGPEASPAPDDLRGLKEADRRLTDRIVAGLRRRAPGAPGAEATFFGPGVDDGRLLGKFAEQEIHFAFGEWKAMACAAPPEGRTVAESLLARRLPEAERRLLLARMRAVPSLYKVLEVHPRGGWFAARDLLDGDDIRVHDAAAAKTLRPGLCLPLRIYPVGDFHFASIAGPGMGPRRAQSALEDLRKQGFDLSVEGRRASPHVFGRLYDFVDRRPADPFLMPRMQNTEGQELEFHRGSFRVEDESVLRAALAGRPDVEAASGDGEFRWLVTEGRGVGLGRTTRGRLEVLPGCLVLETNSKTRFETARGWLEQIPGVRFESLTVRSLDDLFEKGPPADDRRGAGPSVPPTPEFEAAMNAMLRDSYLKWVDEPLPMFGGRTPREMCRTAAGRRRVKREIELTEPPVTTPAMTLQVPKDEMLRALGLS